MQNIFLSVAESVNFNFDLSKVWLGRPILLFVVVFLQQLKTRKVRMKNSIVLPICIKKKRR